MATSDAPHAIVVCDAGPLIHLDEVGQLPLLADFVRVLVPNSVWLEVQRIRPSSLASDDVDLERLTSPPPDSEVSGLASMLLLHAGEQEALCLARQFPGALLLTDDTAARLAAQRLTISVHGTIGILIRAIRRHQLSKADVVMTLRSLPDRSTLHIRRSLLEDIIQQVEREA
jgi:predicted nucleic acid-binding protein